MYTYPWYHWITFFYIYCFFGWIFESTYVSLKSRRFVNRGFLRLPMLPLYGTGAVVILWASLPFQDNMVLVYISGVIAASALEYVTGYAMERMFKMKYWDYSNQPFNLHGYICLSSSIAWGFLTIFLTDVIHQPISRMVLDLNPVLEFTMIAVVSVFFVSDTVKSTREALDLGRALEAMTKIKTEVEELQLQLALLKSEASMKVTEFSEMSLEDKAQKVADSIEDAAHRMVDSLEDAVQRVSDMREETVLHVADLKAETAQRMTDMKEGTVQHMTDMKVETAQRMTDIKDGTSRRIAETAQRLKGHADREYDLSERLKSLNEKRQKLSQHMTFYRKGILRGNPSASSKRFADALKELRDSIDSRRS